ncbi:MAG: hypothetical protein HKO57_06450, partial [Akkermansiaceae bacterium]|nr:hypothetical protein [Akkermansiaceae bacterium]
MARRASSSLNPAVLTGIIAVVLLLIGGGALIFKKKGESFQEVAPLHVQEALENANSLRGNEYRVEGKVESRWVRDTGEALSLLVEEGGRTAHLFIM